jgi:hypothetical protein
MGMVNEKEISNITMAFNKVSIEVYYVEVVRVNSWNVFAIVPGG